MTGTLARGGPPRQMALGQCSSISRQLYRLPVMRHHVVALALPGVVTFDLGCAIQVFAHAPNAAGGPGLYDFTVCGPGGRRARTSDGFSLVLDRGLDALAEADTVVVPGYVPWSEPPPRAAVRALAAAGSRGARVMSICIGAFALGHAALLDGRRATTHWAAAPLLAEQFPQTEVVPDVLYVDEGRVLTSAGLAAGLDLALHVVRSDHGAAAAAEIARWNVVAPHRDGGQAQFAARPIAIAPDAGLGATRTWALARLDQPLDLAALAAHASCSERTLTRRFRAETGSSPKQWLLRMRVQRARELLESTALPVEQVAAQAGFPSAATLRARFAAELQTTPSAYRRTFRGRR
jgi:transcriptional regulator GlxA family with amidase domain